MTGSPVTLEQRIGEAQSRRQLKHRQRARRAYESKPCMMLTDGTRSWINFSSNDYLGLCTDPGLANSLANAAKEHGTGSGASALVTGYHPQHQALEHELAEWLQRDAALVFSSGFLANLAVATSLASKGDTIIQDRLVHASLVDAARLSGARLLRYPHADVRGLAQQLDRADGHAMVVTDGVFSMDGDIAPLATIVKEVSGRATLVVDDAHGIGVLGPGGRGCTAEAGLSQNEVPVLVGTLGKAFGGAGAFVAGSKDLVDELVNAGRSYMYTTALPPAVAAAGRDALALVAGDDWRREKLAANIHRFREGAESMGLELMPSVTPIQPLVLGTEERAIAAAEALDKAGYRVAAMRPPTVPRNTSRLRITLSAVHEPHQVDGLLQVLDQCLEQ